MKVLYTDASFDYKHVDKTTENIVRGKICVSDGNGFHKVDKVAIGKVEGLKQYINILELTAIARAVELAVDYTDKELKVITDSMVAMSWARKGKIGKNVVVTPAHTGALEYLANALKMFGGVVSYEHTGRDNNPAGHVLAAELEKESPHAV